MICPNCGGEKHTAECGVDVVLAKGAIDALDVPIHVERILRAVVARNGRVGTPLGRERYYLARCVLDAALTLQERIDAANEGWDDED